MQPKQISILILSSVLAWVGCQSSPKIEQSRMPSSFVSVYHCKAEKNISAESEDEAKKFFLVYVNNGTTQPGSVKISCSDREPSALAPAASNICFTSGGGTCFVNKAQPVGSPCGCEGYPGSIAPQR